MSVILPPSFGTSALSKAYGWNIGGGDFAAASPSARPSEAAKGWDDFNRAFAHSLPTSLARAGQFQHATLAVLRRRSRIGK